MAKILLLVRHAKSSWNESGLSDHERPLLMSGKQRTALISKYLKEAGVKPDLIIASHAVRALETAKLIAEKLFYPNHKILIERNIYYYDADGLYELVLALPDNKSEVMMVGHNPAMTQFVNMFLDEKLDYLPTTGVVSVSFDVEEWSQIPFATRTLNFFVTPKMLQS